MSLDTELVSKGSYKILIATAISPVVRMRAACIFAVRVSVFLVCQLGLALLAYILHFHRQ